MVHRHIPNLIRATAVLLALTLSAWAVLGEHFNFTAYSQLALKRYGPQTQQTVDKWQKMLASARDSDDEEKIRKVNDFFNDRIAYREDIDIWGQSDYWATPLEMMGRGEADCEDYAIAKYFSLLLLGVPPDRLRITYVKARIGGPYSKVSIAHMVLGYYPATEAEPLVLDNLLHDIRPASRRTDLTPVFTFNSEGIWIGNAPGGASSGSSTARLSRWRDLLNRMKADGFE